MKISTKGLLLRIFVGEDDRIDGKLAYKKILEILREYDIAGATVLRGIMGYGASSRIHKSSILALSSDLPIVIEVVDQEDKIQLILPIMEDLIPSGLITLEKVQIIKYLSNNQKH
ncbi:MAG: DUF190 domain-containing protein [Planctomycetota bacterium]|nr:MAG: DUF190 domain-containing protein [Planctomycetota bacterium]